MSSAATFPARFAELVCLLAHQPECAAEQATVLEAAMSALTRGDASLTTSQLNVDLLDEGQTEDGMRLHELVMRMSAHSAHQIDFLARTPAHEVLGVARILAGDAQPDDDGAAFDEQFVRLDVTAVEVHLGRSGFVRVGRMTPTTTTGIGGTPARTPTPFRGMPAFDGAPRSPNRTPGTDRAVGPTPTRSAAVTPPAGAGTVGLRSTRLTPTHSAPMSGPARTPVTSVPTIRDESPRIIEGAIQTKPLATAADDELIERLRAGVRPQNVTRLLDELVVLAEARARENRWELVARVFTTFVACERAAEDNAELRRAYTIGLRRLTKPTLVRGIAGLLPRRPDMRDQLHDVLLRLGSDGAEALIDLLTTADVLTDRRAYLAALVKCRDAAPTLVHLLGDGRWYVVRNAADLLGEMRATEGEGALVETATHQEERVRRSVATALARLGSARALQAVQQLLSDPVPEVRMHAAQGIGGTRWPRAVSVLSRALEHERDPEVQAVILAALGRQATDDAVARLIRAAEPDGRLFRRKPTALRVSAVQALAEANTPAAFAALRRFAEDREREVRETAARALRPKSDG